MQPFSPLLKMAVANGPPPTTSNYDYFIKYAVATIVARQEESVNGRDFELELFENVLGLQMQLLNNHKDKDRILQWAGKILVGLFYILHVSDAPFTIDSKRRPVYAFRSKKATLEGLCRFLRTFLAHYRDLNHFGFRPAAERSTLGLWIGRLCQVLLNLTELQDLHTLLMCQLQMGNSAELILEQRDDLINRLPEYEAEILSVRVFPLTYDLRRTSWEQVTGIIRKCGLTDEAYNVKLPVIARKVQHQYLETGRLSGETKQQTESRFADDFFCMSNTIDIANHRSLYSALCKWLFADTFQNMCLYQFQGDCPFLRAAPSDSVPARTLQEDIDRYLERLQQNDTLD